VLKTRRSVRAYADRPIPADLLQKVLQAARLAPSVFNLQPWLFIVVTDPATRTKLAQMAQEQEFVAKAPVVIVCLGKHYDQAYNWMGDKMFLLDVAIAVDHLTLAARAEGLGTCWIGAFPNDSIKQLLAIPPELDVVALTPLGFPASEELFSAQTERLPMDQIAFHERFGKP
jgi:nitroreductase